MCEVLESKIILPLACTTKKVKSISYPAKWTIECHFHSKNSQRRGSYISTPISRFWKYCLFKFLPDRSNKYTYRLSLKIGYVGLIGTPRVPLQKTIVVNFSNTGPIFDLEISLDRARQDLKLCPYRWLLGPLNQIFEIYNFMVFKWIFIFDNFFFIFITIYSH